MRGPIVFSLSARLLPRTTPAKSRSTFISSTPDSPSSAQNELGAVAAEFPERHGECARGLVPPALRRLAVELRGGRLRVEMERSREPAGDWHAGEGALARRHLEDDRAA